MKYCFSFRSIWNWIL